MCVWGWVDCLSKRTGAGKKKNILGQVDSLKFAGSLRKLLAGFSYCGSISDAQWFLLIFINRLFCETPNNIFGRRKCVHFKLCYMLRKTLFAGPAAVYKGYSCWHGCLIRKWTFRPGKGMETFHNFLFSLIADWKPNGDPNSGWFSAQSDGPGKWVINSCVWLSGGCWNEVYIYFSMCDFTWRTSDPAALHFE